MSAKLAQFQQHNDLARLLELQHALDQFALTAIILPAGVLISANEKFLQVSGFSSEEVYKKPFQSLLTDEFRNFFVDYVLPILKRGITWKGELSHSARNALTFWTETTIVPIMDANNNIRHYQLIAFEVTERKVVEKALTNNSVFFTRLMEMAPIGFFLADAEGQCTYINRMWSETSGYRLRQALGSAWIEAIHPEDRSAVTAAWMAFITQGQAFNYEYRYRHTSGRIVWVLAVAERLDFAHDARTRFIRVEQDLTQRKESEWLINEQRAQMVAASKMSALGEMAGGIAHEINNPLAILQLRARQIIHLVQPDAPHAKRLMQAAENVRQTTDRIASIVRSMRAIAREGHGDPLLRTPVKALIDHSLELCAARFRSHHISLIMRHIPPDLDIQCRSVEILQVLLNLLNNTFSAVVHLDDKWVEISAHDFEDVVDLWITDSGPGIPREIQSKLFQPFFTTKPVGSGTGLGLSISKAVALDHGGDLWLDADCVHTRFILRIPRVPLKVK